MNYIKGGREDDDAAAEEESSKHCRIKLQQTSRKTMSPHHHYGRMRANAGLVPSQSASRSDQVQLKSANGCNSFQVRIVGRKKKRQRVSASTPLYYSAAHISKAWLLGRSPAWEASVSNPLEGIHHGGILTAAVLV